MVEVCAVETERLLLLHSQELALHQLAIAFGAAGSRTMENRDIANTCCSACRPAG